MFINIKTVKFNIVDSLNPKYVEVLASFIYQGEMHHHYIFITKRKDFRQQDYLDEARKIFLNDIKNKRIDVKHKKKTSPVLVGAVVFFAAAALALGGLLTYHYLKPGDNPGPGPDPKTDYEVNEKEFNDATKMKGVEYAQADMNMVSGAGMTVATQMKMSPGIYYSVSNTTIPQIFTMYSERYSWGNTFSCTYVDRESADAKFSEEKTTTAEEHEAEDDYTNYFMTPQDMDLSEQFESMGLGYKDFKFEDNVYSCHFKEEPEVSNEGYDTFDFVLSFDNKKLIKFEFAEYVEDKKEEGIIAGYTIGYEKIVPEDPRHK